MVRKPVRSVAMFFMLCTLLVALIGVVGFYLLNTSSGLGFLVHYGIARLVPGITVRDIEGGLLGNLRLGGIEVVRDGFTVEIKGITLEWNPYEIISSGRLHVKRLGVEYLAYSTTGQAPVDKGGIKWPTVLPNVSVPIEVALDDVHIGRVAVKGNTVLEFEGLVLRAKMKGATLSIYRLGAGLPGERFSVAARGRFSTSGRFPIDIVLGWKARIEPKGAPKVEGASRVITFQGTGSIRGDVDSLTLSQKVSGDMGGDMRLWVWDLVSGRGPSWRLEVEVDHESRGVLEYLLGAMGVELREGLNVVHEASTTIEIEATGDMERASAHVAVNLVAVGQGELGQSDERGKIGGCAKGGGSLDVEASVRFSDLSYNATLEWTELIWPLGGPPRFVSPAGTVHFVGAGSKYDFSLNAALWGTELSKTTLDVHGHGTGKAATVDHFRAWLLGGEIRGHAQVWLGPVPRWSLFLTGHGLDPSIHWPWLSSHTAFTIDASGEGKGGDLAVSLSRCEASSGNARVTVRGMVSMEDVDLDWSLSVPDAGDVIQGASGSLYSKGSVKGSPKAPRANFHIRGHGLTLFNDSLDDVDVKARLFLDDKGASNLNVVAHGLKIWGHRVKSVEARLAGKRLGHEVVLRVEHEGAGLLLRVDNGRFDLNTGSWAGQLRVLTLTSRDLGEWSLVKGPVSIDASPGHLSIPGICLEATSLGNASICASAEIKGGGNGGLKVAIHGLALDGVAASFAPTALRGVSGVMDATLTAGLGPKAEWAVNATFSPGELIYAMDAKRAIKVHYKGGKIVARLDEDALFARLCLEMEGGDLVASFFIPRRALGGDIRTIPIEGSIRLDVRETGMIGAFIPAVSDVHGDLRGDIRFTGTLENPHVEGRISLETEGTEIVLAGLYLDETNVEIQAHGSDTLKVRGHVRAGDKYIMMSGDVVLNAGEGWPVHVELKGSDFLVLNVPDAVVRTSPDLTIDYSTFDGLKVRGVVELSGAELRLRRLPPEVKTPSSDIVIIGRQRAHSRRDEGPPMDIEVTLYLLDDVHFRGLGLDCLLTGKVTLSFLPTGERLAHGEVRVKKGTLQFYGRDLSIEKGIISWPGGPIDNPGINLLAMRSVRGTDVGVMVKGPLEDLHITGHSTDPTISPQDAIAMLITGKGRHDPGFRKAAANTAKIAGADLLAQILKGYVGLDYLNVRARAADASTAQVFAGKDVTDRLMVGVQVGAEGDGMLFVARYKLYKGVELELQSGASKSGAGLYYTIEIR